MLKIVFGVLFIAGFAASLTLTNSTLSRFKRQTSSCGVPTSKSSGLIYNGETFEKGLWPWIVALVNREATPAKFFCAGTLISRTQVITGEILNFFELTNSLYKRNL
jgi:secreted trypsin-like serine protease